jgi:hypothetical protein
MKVGLSSVIAALDAAETPVNFFLRDDDTGWDDERLFALLGCTQRACVPIDLAVIPQATSAGLAAKLNACLATANGLIGLHQHGYSHTNHESQGRKCEFGDSRDLALQCHDLIAGREYLQELFEARLDSFFTPPWNRCSAATPQLLADLGFSGLSRDHSAPHQSAIPELSVDLDWCKQLRMLRERSESTGDAIALVLATLVKANSTIGIMLHHAQMSVPELEWLRAWLTCWARHPNARWQSMRKLLSVHDQTAPP